MELIALLKSLYLGDCACKAIWIRSWKQEVAIQVDAMSRIQPDGGVVLGSVLEDPWIVFTSVDALSITPLGPIPNDAIEVESVEQVESLQRDGLRYETKLAVTSVQGVGKYVHLTITLRHGGAFVENRDGVRVFASD